MAYDDRGRWYRLNKKRTVEECLSLSPAPLAEGLNWAMDRPDLRGSLWQGSLHWSNADTGEDTSNIGYAIERRGDQDLVLRLWYSSTRPDGEKTDYDYRVALTHTVPNFGGRRWWFICPLVVNDRECGRRVGKLHLPPRARYFGCRHCHDLTYKSTRRSSRADRIDRRLWAIRRQLGSRGNIADPVPPDKPKGMHWETYSALANEYFHLQELRMAAFTCGAIEILGETSLGDGSHLPSLADAQAALDILWQEYKADPDKPRFMFRDHDRFSLDTLRAEVGESSQPHRGTLGEIARKAGVSYQFAKEAESHGLIRPDGGRGTRRKRYRYKLAGWLRKLHVLQDSGYTWEDIRAWTQRRFEPGHEHERRWPAGFPPPNDG